MKTTHYKHVLLRSIVFQPNSLRAVNKSGLLATSKRISVRCVNLYQYSKHHGIRFIIDRYISILPVLLLGLVTCRRGHFLLHHHRRRYRVLPWTRTRHVRHNLFVRLLLGFALLLKIESIDWILRTSKNVIMSENHCKIIIFSLVFAEIQNKGILQNTKNVLVYHRLLLSSDRAKRALKMFIQAFGIFVYLYKTRSTLVLSKS